MISEPLAPTGQPGAPDHAYVWIFLPDRTEPVVAGRLYQDGDALSFIYGRSYLERPDAISLYEPELPLQAGPQRPSAGLVMPGCLRDAAPDAWGRRVILNRRLGLTGPGMDVGRLDELTYALESNSERIGALDFQTSAVAYVPRVAGEASLEELLTAARRVEDGVPITPDLAQALFHGSALGGARPKAQIADGARRFIAKFSSAADIVNVVKSEYVAMRLAAEVGLTVAGVSLERAAGRDVLLVERFDRVVQDGRVTRRPMVSALTIFGLDEMMARYASYEELAEQVRRRFLKPRETLKELFGRLVLNVLVGNTDDHARNHAAFWDGEQLSLTPAYDICPQARTGREAGQAMRIHDQANLSQLSVCARAAASFLLSEDEAWAIMAAQIRVILERWPAICHEAGLTPVDRASLWRRQVLNPFAFIDAPPKIAALEPRV